MSGPVHRALKNSYLAKAIQGGIQAVPGDKRKHFAESVRPEFLDSLDLDEATRERHPTDARWDYLLGHASSSISPGDRARGAGLHPASPALGSPNASARRRALREA